MDLWDILGLALALTLAWVGAVVVTLAAIGLLIWIDGRRRRDQ